jgi:membrane-bound metal-dependent hydrolase YbcI (DUF457 family)
MIMPLDIGIGVFAAIIFAHAMSVPLNWQILAASILFSLMPDIDFAIYFFKRKRLDEFAHEHRDITHNPIIYIVVGFIVASFWSVAVAWLFAALSFWHFLHDSIPEGGGWGIRWLYPFSNKYYKFFAGKDGKSARQFVVSWTPSEQKQAAQKFGDPEWAKHYLRSPELLFELIVFIAAVVTLVLSSGNLLW